MNPFYRPRHCRFSTWRYLAGFAEYVQLRISISLSEMKSKDHSFHHRLE